MRRRVVLSISSLLLAFGLLAPLGGGEAVAEESGLPGSIVYQVPLNNYFRHYDPWLAGSDGGCAALISSDPRQFVDVDLARISPDGRRVILSRLERAYLFDSENGSLLWLLPGGSGRIDELAWSIDGAVVSVAGSKSGKDRVYLYSADGTFLDSIPGQYPRWNPINPHRLAVLDEDLWKVYDLDDLTAPVAALELPAVADDMDPRLWDGSLATWAGDGEALIMGVLHDVDELHGQNRSDVWHVPLDGTARTLAHQSDWQYYDFTQGPDGRILFRESLKDEDGPDRDHLTWRISVMDGDGTNPVPIINVGRFETGWGSPYPWLFGWLDQDTVAVWRYWTADLAVVAVRDGSLIAEVPDPEEAQLLTISPAPSPCGPPMCNGEVATVWGDDSDNVLHGTPGRDVIHGRGGNDTIYGRGGDDLICAADGDDEVWGQTGNDVIFGGNGNDNIMANRGDDFVDAGPGQDLVDGGAGNDTIYGGPGHDHDPSWTPGTPGIAPQRGEVPGLRGGPGNDVIYGEGGKDHLFGDDGSDQLYGGPQNDRLFGSNDGGEILDGGPGNDLLKAGAGDDELDGGTGIDTLIGTFGFDVCRNGPIYKACEAPDVLVELTWTGRGEDPSGDGSPPAGLVAEIEAFAAWLLDRSGSAPPAMTPEVAALLDTVKDSKVVPPIDFQGEWEAGTASDGVTRVSIRQEFWLRRAKQVGFDVMLWENDGTGWMLAGIRLNRYEMEDGDGRNGVTGRVTDATGAPVANVRVSGSECDPDGTITALGVYGTTTDANGEYTIFSPGYRPLFWRVYFGAAHLETVQSEWWEDAGNAAFSTLVVVPPIGYVEINAELDPESGPEGP